MRLERNAVVLGPTADATPVRIVLGFHWRDRAALERFITAVHDPRTPQYQLYLTPRDFAQRFAPRAAQVAAAARYLRRAGLRIIEVSPSRLQLTAEGGAGRVARALGTGLLDLRDSTGQHVVTADAPMLPDSLGAQVVAVGAANVLRPPGADPVRQGIAEAPFKPADISRLYGFDALYAGGVRGDATRSSTIAIATAFAFDPTDLETFWRAHGIARGLDSVEVVPVAGVLAPAEIAPADRMESALDAEWASAMAPEARVLVYAGGDSVSTTFLRVYDRIVTDNRAAVMTTSWGRCETDYPQAYLDQVDAVFARAAAQGITVVAAAGDHGAFECGGTTPSVSFPASHPYVLAVGGTGLRPDGDAFIETSWSGSGGGTSARFSAPPWQMNPSSGRAMSDVAFNADPASGYLIVNDGIWYAAGGTSVSAPIWAALIALSNQARAAAGRGSLGLAAPQLCELAAASDLAPAPFADIVSGDNGAFAAAPGWDFPTGWGAPRADRMVDALAHWTPPADGRGGVDTILPLVPVSDRVHGAVRLRYQRRCLTTELDVHVRGLADGSYTLLLDDEPVVSFSPDSRGSAILSVQDAAVGGRHVTVVDATGAVQFALAGDVSGPQDFQSSAALKNTGAASGAMGTLTYRAGNGREQLTVHAERLPGGRYDVRVGADTIGALTVDESGAAANASFDTFGLSGAPLSSSPMCKPILLIRSGSAYLRSVSDALAPGKCVDGERLA